MDTFEKICEISNRLLVISIEQKKFFEKRNQFVKRRLNRTLAKKKRKILLGK